MKLHLPKLLCVALMGVLALPAMGDDTLTTDNIVTPVEGGDSYLNVGTEYATDTWKGDLVVGDTAEAQGHVDYVGAFNESWGFVTPSGKKTITSSLLVTGSLTVQKGGKIVLGGQSGSYYTGLEATNGITVTGGSLTSTKIVTNNLVVSGGSVSTSTGDCTSGNRVGTSSWYLAKKSYIKNSLTLSGGSLSFGYTDNVQGIGLGTHCMTAFGSSSSFTMNQTGGTMKVYGDMDLRAGATINQEEGAGLMSLRDTIYMGDSGTTTFNQSGDNAKLVLGRLESTSTSNAHEFVFDQSGNGLIHLAYGSNMAKASTISLIQSGSGTINIGGGHDTKITGPLPSRGYALNNNNGTDKIYTDDYPEFEAINTTYNIEQTGAGTITIKDNAAIAVKDLTQGADAILNVYGSLTVVGSASLEGTVNVGDNAIFTYAEGANMEVTTTLALDSTNTMNFTIGSTTDDNGSVQMAASGDLAVTGGILTLELTDVALTEMAAGATFEGTEYGITLISGLSDADVLEPESVINDALTLQKYEKELPIVLAEGDSNLPITIVSDGLRLEGDKLQAVVVATNPNLVVPEPTTATLSLLALAALAARRRRR